MSKISTLLAKRKASSQFRTDYYWKFWRNDKKKQEKVVDAPGRQANGKSRKGIPKNLREKERKRRREKERRIYKSYVERKIFLIHLYIYLNISLLYCLILYLTNRKEGRHEIRGLCS